MKMQRPTFVVAVLSMAAVCTLVACSAESSSELSQAAQPAQSKSTSSAASPRLETVYQEPADRPSVESLAPSSPAVRELARSGEASPVDLGIAFEAQGAPIGTDILARRLRSHHVESLPSSEELQGEPAFVAQLLFLEDHATLILERQRSLSLMRHLYDHADIRARLLLRASDENALVPARIAALQSLKEVAPSGDVEAQEALRAAAQSEQNRVRRAVQSD